MLISQTSNKGGQIPIRPPINTLYQVQVYYRPFGKKKGITSFAKEIRKLFIPLASQYVFATAKEAQAFAPSFIDHLIKEGVVNERDIFLDVEKKKINSDNLGIVIMPLTILAASEDGASVDDFGDLLREDNRMENETENGEEA